MSDTTSILGLLNDLVKAIEGGSKKKLKQTIKSLQLLLDSLDSNAATVLENDDNPFKNTNLIILCCKFGQLNFLDDFLNNGKQFIDNVFSGTIANVLSPFDEDAEGHSAFYYAIRSNNVEIVELLLTKWLPTFEDCVAYNDSLLSKAYEELKLRNVRLTEEMEFFVESEIIASHFHSSIDEERTLNSSNDLGLLKRIDWLQSNIETLNTVEVESNFLVLAKCVAQNMNTLKHQLKATYQILPWEEMEFCLISYIVSKLQPQEKSVLPFVAITKKTLLDQLGYFATILKTLSLHYLLGPNEFPNMRREEVVLRIKKNSRHFILLYESYEIVRDMYSLEKLEGYINLSLSVNHKEKLGQLAILRVLQVLSKYLENTHDNCKLSDATSRVILSAIPRTTRETVIELQNTVSDAHSLKIRVEIEDERPQFFRGVQKNLKFLSFLISRILNNEKLRIVVDSLEKLTKSNDIEEVCELLKKIKSARKCIDVENFKLFEEEKIRTSISKLRRFFPELSDKFKDIVNGLPGESLKSDPEQFRPASLRATDLQCLDKLKSFDRPLDVSDIPLIRRASLVALRILSPTTYTDTMSKVHDVIKEIDETIKRGNDTRRNEGEIYMLIFEISMYASARVKDVACLDTTDVSESIDSSELTLSEIERENYLKSKLVVLKNLIGSEVKSAFFLKENKKLMLAAELLLLDVLTILGGDDCSSENSILFPGIYTPVLIGKSLMNHLAHGIDLVNILPIDPATAILANAIQFIKHVIKPDDVIMGKVSYDDVSKAKERLKEKMKIMTNQDHLFPALEKGDIEKCRAMIKSGADIFGRNISHESTFHFAAKSLDKDLAKFIFEQNVEADSTDNEGRTALHVAAEHGNFDLIEHLTVTGIVDLEQRDKNGQTCLHLAAKHGEKKTVAYLLEMGADISAMDENSRTPLFSAIENNNFGVVGTLLDHDSDMGGYEAFGRFSPLHFAAVLNRVDIINLLIQKGADVNAYYVDGLEFRTALHCGVDKGLTAVAAILLQNGADANTPKNPEKPIHIAARNGQLEIVKLLIEHKADVNCKDPMGLAPIHLAAQGDHAEVIKTLLIACVDIHIRDSSDRTALHWSASNGCLEATKLLIDKKAELNARDSSLCTALHLAAKNGSLTVVKLLLMSGAICDLKNRDGTTPQGLSANYRVNRVLNMVKQKLNGARRGHLGMLGYMSKEDVCIVTNARNFEGLTMYQIANKLNHQETVKEIERYATRAGDLFELRLLL